MIVSSEAIILQSRKFSDTSKILSAYTKDHGKVSLLAKGARNIKSKFGGSLEQLSHCTATFYLKPNKDLFLLSKSEFTIHRRRLTESYERLAAALAILEAVETSQDSGEANLILFNLLTSALDALNSTTHNEYSIVVSFQIQLANLMGFALTMNRANISEPRSEYLFSFADGAILSENDYRVPASSWVFDASEYDALNTLSYCSFAEAAEVEQSIVQKEKIHNFLVQYFKFHLVKSMRHRTHTLLLDLC